MLDATRLPIPDDADTRRVYHVSPTILVPAIEIHGVRPEMANGMMKVSWWCEKQALMWAISHVSALKSISVDQLSIWQGVFWAGLLKNTRSKHVYTCAAPAWPARVYTATDVFKWIAPDGEWLNG